jgi:integrase
MGRKRKNNPEHLPEGVYKERRCYYYRVKGKRINLGRNKTEALHKWVNLKENSDVIYTISDMVDRYMKEVSVAKKPATHQRERYIAPIVREVFGTMHPTELEPQHIYYATDAISKKSIANANKVISFISEMYKKGIRWGVVKTNPCTDIERYDQPARTREVTDEELAAYYSICHPFLKAYIKVLYFAGKRAGEPLKIKMVDIVEKGVLFDADKTGKKQLVEWTKPFYEAVEEAKKLHGNIVWTHLFVTKKGKPYTKSGLDSMHQRYMDKAMGQVRNKKNKLLPPERQPTPILTERFTLQDLRSKAADSTDLDHAAKLLDHSDKRTTEKWYRRKQKISEVKALDNDLFSTK